MVKAVSSKLSNCYLLNLPKVHNRAGNITSINNNSDIPFSVKRVYYLYDIPGGESRGGHAHKALQQIIVAASGSFNITLDDGVTKRSYHLNRPNQGLLIVPGIWREINNISSGAICLVLASDIYNEDDYIRDYKSFLNYIHNE